MGAGLTRDTAGIAAAAGAWMAAATSSTSLTVTVNGTTITSPIDSAGRFTLNRVPAGTLRLDFSGNGASASVVISGVTAGDHIDLVVMLNGTRADLQSQSVEAEGIVSGLFGSCPSLAFTLNGRAVHTNAATRFEGGACSGVSNNDRIEVTGTKQNDGSLLATKIDRENDAENDDRNTLTGTVSALSGTCPTLTFVVAGSTILTNSGTRFDGGCSAVRNGRKVEVKGTTPVVGGLLAAAVEIDD